MAINGLKMADFGLKWPENGLKMADFGLKWPEMA